MTRRFGLLSLPVRDGDFVPGRTWAKWANALAAVEQGATQVQGTINGYGERTGNCNLTSAIPNIALKMGRRSISKARLKKLREVSRFVDEVANLVPDRH